VALPFCAAGRARFFFNAFAVAMKGETDSRAQMMSGASRRVDVRRTSLSCDVFGIELSGYDSALESFECVSPDARVARFEREDRGYAMKPRGKRQALREGKSKKVKGKRRKARASISFAFYLFTFAFI
jgi:hypothetical protein